MNKVKVKVVIGSNYGDEGKGLASHYFSLNNGKVLNVLYNGGAQRGHTVEYKSGKRMVFHHFGAGLFDGADTYFDEDFMVNPMTFCEEFLKIINSDCRPVINCFISPNCRFVTPADMLLNQVVEIVRSKNKHGSCGHGIWETQKRYELSEFNLTFEQFAKLSKEDKKNYLRRAKEFSANRFYNTYEFEEMPRFYKKMFEEYDGFIEHYINDFNLMCSVAKIKNFEDIVYNYDTIVFEGAQGLELDENNKKALPYITASSTGSLVPIKRMCGIEFSEIEICYITRSYFTRHGAGTFPTECNVKEIGDNIKDKTNVDNDFQDSLRYGYFNKEQMMSRIQWDLIKTRAECGAFKTSLMITHLNETNKDICGDCSIKDLIETYLFDKVYLSYTPYAEDIKDPYLI